MVREVNLLGHLPPFVQEYLEIRHIMFAENPEFQFMEDETEKIKNNQFLLTCDEDGIKKFEDLLDIPSYPEDTLEARISRVITRWNDALPYTLRGLDAKLKAMCGEGNYQILPNFNDYELHLVVYLPLSGQMEELDYMLSYMIPANIKWTCRNAIPHVWTATVNTGGVVVTCSKFTIDSKTNTERILKGKVIDSAAVSKYLQRTIQ